MVTLAPVTGWTAHPRRPGYLRRDQPFLAVYRLEEPGHVQTGLVGDLPLDAYREGRIRIHEHVREERVEELRDLLERTGLVSEPVSVAHRPLDRLDRLVSGLTERTATVESTSPDEVRHRLWVVDDPDDVARVVDAISPIETVTIIDGHHRAAAAAAFGERQGEAADRLLTVLFPYRELKTEAWDRVVEDPSVEVDTWLDSLRDRVPAVRSLSRPARPDRQGVVTAWADRRWWEIELPLVGDDRVESLDVSVLHREVLDSVGGEVTPVPAEDPATLADRAGPDGLAFALFPVPVDHLMTIVDAGEVMPPKSTYFTPKVRSGLIVARRS